MNCKNHYAVEAVDRCVGCAEPFCANCLVEVLGQKYCASCKVMAVQGTPVLDEGDYPCKEAGEALTYAIIGLFCCGIILEPIAIQKALEAKKMINADPRLSGIGKANTALILGIIGLVLWVLGMFARFSKFGR